MKPRVAVLGATGLVGRTLLRILEERAFPAREVIALASARSAGSTLRFRGGELTVRRAEPAAFDGVDVVLSSAGAAASRELLPAAAERGAVSIDNTSAFRMEPDVPLVVPEVNPHRIGDYGRRRIIANPNCSTIQLVVALAPLSDAFGVRRVIVSTYQSVSGAGQGAVDQLLADTRRDLRAGSDGSAPGRDAAGSYAFNALPQIDVFRDGGDTREEWKMTVETPKIMEAEVPLHATCVRVPVVYGHSEAVWLETERPASPEEARTVLRGAPGVEVVDDPASRNDPASRAYPTARHAAGRDPVYVGRIRRDPTAENALAMWIVADNIRKGAALNAVQIAERLIELLRPPR